jgi:aminoglycoside/choline kinase family phosphotransferase
MRAFRGSQMPPQIAWPSAERQAHFERLAGRHRGPRHGLDPATLEPGFGRRQLSPLPAGAGSRGSLIVMDAPPPLEDVRPFVRVAGLIARAGLHAPRVLQADAVQGFLLLTDLGEAAVPAGAAGRRRRRPTG